MPFARGSSLSRHFERREDPGDEVDSNSLNLTCTMWATYPGTKLMDAAFKLRKKMKNSSSCAHVLQ